MSTQRIVSAGSLLVAILLVGCSGVRGDRRDDLAMMPPVPAAAVGLGGEPCRVHAGHHRHDGVGGWFYARVWSGPWTAVSSEHCPRVATPSMAVRGKTGDGTPSAKGGNTCVRRDEQLAAQAG